MEGRQLPAVTRIGRVRLRVSDLDRSLRCYRDLLGLHPVSAGKSPDGEGAAPPESGAGAPVVPPAGPAGAPETPPGGAAGVAEGPSPRRIVGLATRPGGPPMVILEEAPGARGPAPRSAGLARVVVRLAEAGWPFEGFADHLVSEAVYLRDPDGLGLELYADRPRATWRYRGAEVTMATLPLDLEGLLRELTRGPSSQEGPEAGIPAGTVVGHVHLQVSDLGRSEAFYRGLLGLEVTNRSFPGPSFWLRVATITTSRSTPGLEGVSSGGWAGTEVSARPGVLSPGGPFPVFHLDFLP